MKLTEAFHTDRLFAERLQAHHFDELCQMHRNPEVMATLGGIRSDELTRQFLHDNLAHWQRWGYGLWVFRDKASGDFVGRGGLRNVQIEDSDAVELAYALMPAFWGKGLATEMSEAILAVGFDRLGLTNAVCFTLTANRASQRVMEKVGFEYKCDIIHADLPHVFYRITASQFGKRQPL